VATPEEAYERLVQGFNDHDVDAIMASYTQDAQLITPDGELRGQAAIRAYWAVWLEAFPDITLTPTRRLCTGNTTVEEAVATGTHTGVLHSPQGDIPPTGKRIEVPYINVSTVEGGLVATDHNAWDRVAVLEQLGLIPATAAT